MLAVAEVEDAVAQVRHAIVLRLIPLPLVVIPAAAATAAAAAIASTLTASVASTLLAAVGAPAIPHGGRCCATTCCSNDVMVSHHSQMGLEVRLASD